MKAYMAFAWMNFYPRGAFNDLIGYADTTEELILKILECVNSKYSDIYCEGEFQIRSTEDHSVIIQGSIEYDDSKDNVDGWKLMLVEDLEGIAIKHKMP